MNKEGISKNVILFNILFVCLVVIFIVTMFIRYSKIDSKENIEELNGGEISLTYTDDTNEFYVSGLLPISDEQGVLLDSADQFYDFTISTIISNANKISYEIILDKIITNSNVNNNNVKVYLEKEINGSYEKIKDPMVFGYNKISDTYDDSMIIHRFTTNKNMKENFRLRLWLDKSAVIDKSKDNKFSLKISVKGKAS